MATLTRYISLLVLILIVSSSVEAQRLCRGLDILSLPRQNVGMIAATIKRGTCIGLLAATFGPSIAPLEKLLLTGKVPAWRAHLTNGACERNGNCERVECGPKDLRCLARRAQAFEALALRYPHTQCFLSPRLEHNSRDPKLVRKWVKVIQTNAPHCAPVISTVSAFQPRETLSERHGNKNFPADIVSNDGDSLFRASSSFLKRGRLITFGWIHACNLLPPYKAPFIPPSKRTNKYRLTKPDVLRMLNILDL